MSTIPALFAEYGTVNSANNPVNLSARNTAFSYTASDGVTLVSGSSPTATLSASDVATYSLSNVLSGSDSWDATLKPQTTASPANLAVNSGVLGWDAVDGAVCYVVVKDGLVSSFTTSTSISATNGIYDIVAVSEFGALSAKSSLTISDLGTGLTKDVVKLPSLKSNVIDQVIEINNPEGMKSIELVNTTGQLLKSVSGSISRVAVPALQPGLYLVNIYLTNGSRITARVIKQ